MVKPNIVSLCWVSIQALHTVLRIGMDFPMFIGYDKSTKLENRRRYMTHDNHCGCGCGHDHDHTPNATAPATPDQVTPNQKDFLHELHHRHYLPVARFTLTDSRELGFLSTALAPVFIRSIGDDMAAVKEAGAFLQKLAGMGLLTLDYDMPLKGYGYEEYKDSALYAYFCDTAAEGVAKHNFLGNTPRLDLGSMALTEAGEQIAATHCGHDHHHHE